MSDPVTNVEIEDVLSSIRRLVADGGDVPNTEQSEDTNATEAEPRFVLTPSLRVADADAMAATGADADPIETDSVDPSFEEPIEPEVSDMDEQELEKAAAFVAPAPLLLTPDTQADEPLIHDAMSEEDRATLEAKIAELEEAVSSAPQSDWEPDGSEVQETSGLIEMFDQLSDEAEAHEPLDVIVSDEPSQEDASAAFAATQEAEAPIFEPQVDVEEVETSENMELADVAEAEQPAPQFRHLPVDDHPTDYGDDLQDDGLPIPDNLDETIAAYIAGGSSVKDEELRQLIVDVVRQELRGELGERITRNVRKMVRREVLGALQTRGID